MGILGNGIYTLSEAAKLTRLRQVRVREWFNGKGTTPSGKRAFQSDYPPVGGDRAISFYDLIELFIIGQLRESAVSLGCLRKVYEQLQKDLKTRHPFCQRDILPRLASVLIRELVDQTESELVGTANRRRASHAGLPPSLEGIDRDEFHGEVASQIDSDLVGAMDRCRVFPETLLAFFKQIDYDEATGTAKRWRIADRVVIDPAICLGKPIVEDAGIATAILAASYEANDHDAERVADWFKVHASHVLAAVEFERSIAA